MSELHEKKISEMTYTTHDPENERDVVTIEDLKSWAIAVIKNRQNLRINGWGGSSPDFEQGLTAFLMDRFEITEEDLK